MVTIRLARGGAKKKPFYHITVARGREERLRLDLERMAYWQSQGAQVTPRVATLARNAQEQAAAQDAQAPASSEG